jgi:hypothetical protein
MKRTPKNQVIENQISKPGELTYYNNGLDYEGKYHIINGRAYAGDKQSFHEIPILLIPKKDNPRSKLINKMGYANDAFNRASSNLNFAYSLFKTISHIIKKSQTTLYGVHYYYYNLTKPDEINEINENDYIDIKSAQNPVYKLVVLDFDKNDIDTQIKEAKKIIPNIDIFLNL